MRVILYVIRYRTTDPPPSSLPLPYSAWHWIAIWHCYVGVVEQPPTAAGTTSTTTRTDKGGSYYPLLCIILLICVYNALQDSHILLSFLHPLQGHSFTTENGNNNNNEILPVKLISQLHHLQHNQHHPPPSSSSLYPIIKIPSPFTSSVHSFNSPVRLQRSSRVYSLIQYHSQSAINHHPPHSLNSIIIAPQLEECLPKINLRIIVRLGQATSRANKYSDQGDTIYPPAAADSRYQLSRATQVTRGNVWVRYRDLTQPPSPSSWWRR